MSPEEKYIKAWKDVMKHVSMLTTPLSSRDMAYHQNDLEDICDLAGVRLGMKLFINTFGRKD